MRNLNRHEASLVHRLNQTKQTTNTKQMWHLNNGVGIQQVNICAN